MMKFSDQVIRNLRENSQYDTFQHMPRKELQSYLEDLKSDHELVKDDSPDHYGQDIIEVEQYLKEEELK